MRSGSKGAVEGSMKAMRMIKSDLLVSKIVTPITEDIWH